MIACTGDAKWIWAALGGGDKVRLSVFWQNEQMQALLKLQAFRNVFGDAEEELETFDAAAGPGTAAPKCAPLDAAAPVQRVAAEAEDIVDLGEAIKTLTNGIDKCACASPGPTRTRRRVSPPAPLLSD